MTTTIETLAEYAAMQTIIPEHVRQMIDEHGEQALVEVIRKHTPFGTFVTSIQIIAA